MNKLISEAKEGRIILFLVNSKGVLQFEDHLCVPNMGDLRREILNEVHKSAYARHPSVTKMY